MARLVGVRQIWTFIGFYAGCMAALVGGQIAFWRMLRDENTSPSYRAIAVALGVLALVPFGLFVPWIYRRSDEYERHRILLSIAIAFFLMALGLTLEDGLQRAGFVQWGAFGSSLWVIAPSWVLAVIFLRLRGSRQE